MECTSITSRYEIAALLQCTFLLYDNKSCSPLSCLQIVPTRYVFLNGTVIETNQFSVTEHLRHVNPGGGRGLPGVFFFYEISPLHVEIVEGYRKGWIAFFTSVCAIVGGVVTTMGLLDQFLYARKTASNNGLLR